MTKTMTSPNAGKGVERQEFLLTADRNGTAMLEDNLAESDKTKQTFTISNHTPWYLPK
jgi:hypothetical protein